MSCSVDTVNSQDMDNTQLALWLLNDDIMIILVSCTIPSLNLLVTYHGIESAVGHYDLRHLSVMVLSHHLVYSIRHIGEEGQRMKFSRYNLLLGNYIRTIPCQESLILHK